MYDVVSVLTRAYACRRDGWWHQLIEFIMVRLVLVTVLVLTLRRKLASSILKRACSADDIKFLIWFGLLQRDKDIY